MREVLSIPLEFEPHGVGELPYVRVVAGQELPLALGKRLADCGDIVRFFLPRDLRAFPLVEAERDDPVVPAGLDEFQFAQRTGETGQEHWAFVRAVQVHRRNDGRLVNEGLKVDRLPVLVLENDVRGNDRAQFFLQRDVGRRGRLLVGWRRGGNEEGEHQQGDQFAHEYLRKG